MARRRRDEHEEDAASPERIPRPPEPAVVEDEAEGPERLAASVGNQAFGVLAREGAGLLPDGRVHPDVEAAIAAQRGRGHGLDPGTRERVAPALGDPLEDVRVHTGPEADALTRSVDARAFATGRDLFFAEGEHKPGSAAGERLLAHELAHVVQQRGAPEGGPMTVSQPGDALEREADEVSDELGG